MRRRKKSKVIVFLCIALVFMGIGYAAIQTNLNISGTSKASGTFNVQITDVEEDEVSSSIGGVPAAKKSATHTQTIATISAEFAKPGDFVWYQVDVSNLGSIDAIIDVTIDDEVLASEEDGHGNKIYLFSVTPSARQELLVGETKTLLVKIEYNKNAQSFPANEEVTFTVSVTATQKGDQTVEPLPVVESELDYIVDNSGLITGYNTNKVQYDQDGYLVIPAVNEEGKQIKAIDSGSFTQKNVASFGLYDSETEEEVYGIIIYDEENFDALKTIVEGLIYGDGSGDGSGYSSSDTSEILKKGLIPSKLLNNKKTGKIIRLEDDEEEVFPILSESEFNAIKARMNQENLQEYYEYIYIDPVSGDLFMAGCVETKIDFTNAIYLEEIRASAFEDSQLESIKLPQNGALTTIGESAFEDSYLSGTLTIPSTVTTIGNSAFYENHLNALDLSNTSNLQTIGEQVFSSNQLSGTLTIPSTVTSIEDYAFSNNQISTLNLSSAINLETIGHSAFYNNQLTGTLTIPSSVTSIGTYAFYGLSDGSTNQISALDLSHATSLNTIGAYAFQDNQISGALTIPSGITSINDNVFYGNSITSISFPNNLTSIGDNAFYSNPISGTLTIPNSVTSIGNGAYNSTSKNVTTLTIPSSVSSIGSSAFSGGTIASISVDIANIPSYAFSNCGVQSITFGSNVRTIDSYAFQNHQLSGSMTIPNYITSIGNYAFAADSSNPQTLTTLTLGTGLTSVGYGAFQNTTVPNLVIKQFSSNIVASFNDKYPGVVSLTIESGAISSSALSNNLSNTTTTLIIGNGVTSIGSGAFFNNSISTLNLTNASSLVSFESYCFSNNLIGTLDLSNTTSLTSIGENAFSQNPISGTLTIPNSVTNIGYYAFNSTSKNVTTLTIPSSVTSIGSNAFYGGTIQSLSIDIENIPSYTFSNNGVQSITFGSNVRTIGDYAFQNHQLSGTLTIPNGITSIGQFAFASSNSNPQTITTLTLGTGLSSISSAAFQNTTTTNLIIKQYSSNIAFDFNYKYTGVVNLTIESGSIPGNAFFNKLNNTTTSLSIGSGVTSIGLAAFKSNQISTLNLSGATNLETIGDYAFENNQLSGTLVIPSSVTSIGIYAFYGESNGSTNQLTGLNLSNATSLETIGLSAFSDNQLTGTLTIPSSVTSIGNLAFKGASDGSTNQLTGLNLSGATSLETIGGYAFQYNQLSGTLVIPSSVTSIGNYAFSNNQLNGTLIIPNSVTTIGSNAFYANQISTLNLINVTNLETIGDGAFLYNQLSGTLTIPSSVTTIGQYAFRSNQISTLNLSNVTNLETIGDGAFENNQLSGTLVIPSSVTSIGYSAFMGSSDGSTNQLVGLNISSATSLETIGPYAFYCNQLGGTLTIPSSVTSIGELAFYNNQISTLNLSNATSLETIGKQAFQDNQLSGTLVIPSSVTSIGSNAFKGSSDGSTNQLTGLNLSNATSLETIGNSAFEDNQLSGTLTIPSSMTSIWGYAFDGNQLSGLNLNNATSLETIGVWAFENNQLSGTLTIPSSVTSIGERAFYLNQISTLNLTNATSLETIGPYAFYSNLLTGTLVIPSSVTSIGDYVFYSNQLTGTLVIPSSVTNIGYYAFCGNKIEILNIGSGLTSLGSNAFYNNYDSILQQYTLTTINIDMTESTWNSRNLPTTGWYGGNPTITYNQS